MYNKRKTKEIFNMIEKIIPDRISLTLPTVFGEELTFLEFCGKVRAKLNESIDVVNENTKDIQQNALDIQQNATAISKNESDIVKLNGVVNSISAQADDNTADILNRKIESLFAPVILNVDSHLSGADINASVYVRISRINPQGLGCLYAKVNISFSGATDAKTLKINSIQFGDRKALDITSVSTSFTAKTDVINVPIYIESSSEIPAGTSDISVTGINLFGMSIVASSLDSSFALDSIPTGIDIPCESLAFTSPAGGEEGTKLVYTFKASEGCLDIFAAAAGIESMSSQPLIKTNFTDIISNSKIFAQFFTNRGLFKSNTVASIPDTGAVLSAAMINYTDFNGDGEHVYTARATLRTISSAGSSNLIKKDGNASLSVSFKEFVHISLTFDMFN